MIMTIPLMISIEAIRGFSVSVSCVSVVVVVVAVIYVKD